MVYDDNEDSKIPETASDAAAEETAAQAPAEESVSAEEPSEDMADWAEMAEAAPPEFKHGDIVEGIVVGVGPEGVSVDIGAKLEGLISRAEFPSQDDLPKNGDTIDVAIMKTDEDAGVIKVSKRRADFERVWNELEESAKSGELVDAMVTERVKGGLRVDLGVSGFVPASQVGTRDVRNLERFVGRSLKLKVLEVDRRAKKVVLSHRQVVEAEREAKREETMAKLEEGAVLEGKVRNLTPYGAFIDLGGVDGLLHISEMSWTRIKDPSEVLSVGETINVTVLEINAETGKISLSRRQILPDPWKEAAKKLRPGQMVHGHITRVVRTGAFAQLDGAEIEGFIPISEMSDKRINDPKEVVSPGQEVDLKINDIRVEGRRMSLSLVGAAAEKERQELKTYMNKQPEAKLTLGDKFGALFQQMDVSAEPPAKEETETVREQAASVPQVVQVPDAETAAEQDNTEASPSELALSEEAAPADESRVDLDEVPADDDTEAAALDNVQPEEPAAEAAAEDENA
ncbi:MAG: 30S ribosomal protein S1 [Armatimonadota bacterium]